MILFCSLQNDQASYAEDVFAAQADGLIGNAEADGTEVVVELRDNLNQFFGDGEAGCSGEIC